MVLLYGLRIGGFMSEVPASPKTSNTYSILGITFGGVSFLLFPIVFGPAAIILAVVAKTKNERLGNIALTVAILGTLFGFILGAVVFSMI
jgi:hypothetical protein